MAGGSPELRKRFARRALSKRRIILETLGMTVKLPDVQKMRG